MQDALISTALLQRFSRFDRSIVRVYSRYRPHVTVNQRHDAAQCADTDPFMPDAEREGLQQALQQVQWSRPGCPLQVFLFLHCSFHLLLRTALMSTEDPL